jgi:hypothetical protein
MPSNVRKIMQVDLSSHAIAYGQNGQRYIDQTQKLKDGCLVISSQAPKSSDLDKISEVATTHFKRDYFVDSVYNTLPASKAVMSIDWNMFYKNFLENEQKSNEKSQLSIKTVDVYGILNSGIRKFIFRKVEEENIELIQQQLNKDIPSLDEIKTRVNEAIKLTQLPFSGGRAAWKDLNPIAFYYLPIGQQLQVTLEKGNIIEVKANKKPLIFAYPILPDVEKEKTSIMIDLLKSQFKESIDIASIDVHPIELNEPLTIREVISSV